jgi:hypothetical protein
MVAEMLHRMNVRMGDEMLGKGPFNPWGLWENINFYQVNRELLYSAGGHWADPPAQDRINEAAKWMAHTMRGLAEWNSSRYTKWGFKDPRTVLTIPGWERHLPDPQYVILRRDKEAVVESLHSRAKQGGPGWDVGHSRTDWSNLYNEYQARLERFLQVNERPAIGLDSDLLMSRSTAPDECARLADFVGGDPRLAYEAIRFKNEGEER